MGGFYKKGGTIVNNNAKYHLIIDLDGTVAQWATAEKSFEELLQPGYFYQLMPEYKLIKGIEELLSFNHDFDGYVLSAYFTDTPYPLEDKKKWVSTWLQFVPKEKCIYVPYGENKAEFFEKETGIKIDKNCIMLEDYTPALNDFVAAGGTGIKFMNGINGTKGTWKGPKLFKEDIQRKKYALRSLLRYELGFNV